MGFERKNIVTDPGIVSHFTQGVQEGVAARGAEITYRVDIEFEGTALNSRTFEDLDEAIEFVRYSAQTPGTMIIMHTQQHSSNQISSRVNVSGEAVLIRDGEVVDAEIVEEEE